MGRKKRVNHTIKLVAQPRFLLMLRTAAKDVTAAHARLGIAKSLDEKTLKRVLEQQTRIIHPYTANLAVTRMMQAAISKVDFEVDGHPMWTVHHARYWHSAQISELDPYLVNLNWANYVNHHPVRYTASFDLRKGSKQRVSVLEETFPIPGDFD